METTSTKKSETARSRSPKQLLVDSRVTRLQLVEGTETAGKTIMRGEFAKCGIATENKRVYPQKLWEREFKRLAKAMENRSLYGLIDHPVSGRTELEKASHIITNLRIENGVVIGEAEVLDTQRGRDLKAIIEAGCSIGISSRGYGSVAANESGEQVVQDDYRLVTFDFVADPADQDAYPKAFSEEKEEESMSEAEMAAKFAQEVEKAKKETKEGLEASLREEFAKEIVTKLAEMRAQVAEEVRTELLGDPSVAGAKSALEQVKVILRGYMLPEDAKAVTEQKESEIAELRKQIAEQDLKIKELEDTQVQLESLAKEAGFKFYVERQIAGDPDAGLIRSLIGDVKVFDSGDQLKERIETVRKDLAEKREIAQKLSEQIEAEKAAETERKERERERAVEHEAKLSEEVTQLRTALEKSLQANKQLQLENYAESRLRNHPRASEIRPLIEGKLLESKEQIDTVVSKFRAPALDADQLESVRSRVRTLTRGGQGPTPIEEEKTPRARTGDDPFAVLGSSIEELRHISGLTR